MTVSNAPTALSAAQPDSRVMADLRRALRPEFDQLAVAVLPMVAIATASAGLAWLGGPLLVALLGATAGSTLPRAALDRLPAGLAQPTAEPSSLPDLVAGDTTLVALVLGLSGLAALRGLAQYAQAAATERLQQGSMERVRRLLFDGILLAGERARLSLSPAEIASRVAGDVQRLESLVGGGALSALTHGLTLLVLGAFALSIDKTIAGLALLSLPPVAFLGYWLSRRARTSSEDALRAHSDLAREVGDVTAGATQFRRAGAVDWVREKLHSRAATSRERMMEAARARAVLGPAMGFTASVAFAFTLVVAQERIRAGMLSTEATGSLVVALLLIVRPMTALGTLAGTLSQGAAAFRRIGLLLTELGAHGVRHAGATRRPFESLTLSNVHVILDGHEVLKDISLEIKRGETIAIVGPNGAGKSTLIEVLLGHLEPDKGTITARIGGSDAGPDEIAYGWVPDEPAILRGTLRENITLGTSDDTGVELTDTLERAGLTQWASAMAGGLDAPLAAGGRGLSLGERQRVALARALHRAPEVLVMDEPTAHLDQDAAVAFEALLRGRRSDETVLVVSHRPETIALVRRIVVIENGRIVSDGAAP